MKISYGVEWICSWACLFLACNLCVTGKENRALFECHKYISFMDSVAPIDSGGNIRIKKKNYIDCGRSDIIPKGYLSFWGNISRLFIKLLVVLIMWLTKNHLAEVVLVCSIIEVPLGHILKSFTGWRCFSYVEVPCNYLPSGRWNCFLYQKLEGLSED